MWGLISLLALQCGPLGKNAYAMSVLRRVEMKLDGRDIADNNRYFFLLWNSIAKSLIFG